MQNSEEVALSKVAYKLICFFHYVDMFMIWLHGAGKLNDFLNHINGIHPNIQFVMETKSDGHFPFLDNNIHRRPNSSVGHTVYRKLIHTNLYPNAMPHHLLNMHCVIHLGTQS